MRAPLRHKYGFALGEHREMFSEFEETAKIVD